MITLIIKIQFATITIARCALEIMIFQQLLKLSRQDKKAGWYDIPIAKFDGFFQLLAKELRLHKF